MDIRYIEEFLYVADTLSFKKAAEHFFVSRSVISRHISALEEAVGARLLQRDSHSVHLTNAGEVFHREARLLARDWEIALERTRQASGGDCTIVRLGYLRNAARPVLSRFVREMKLRHPDINLSLVCMDHIDLIRAIAEDEVDVALAVDVDPSISSHYRSTPIYSDRYTIVCALDHPLAQGNGVVKLSGLRNQKLLMPDSYVFGRQLDFVKNLIDEETMHVSRSTYADADALLLMVETEDLLAFSSTINNRMFEGRLSVLQILDVDTSFRVSAFYGHSFTGRGYEACREVFEWCHDHMREWYPTLALEG